MGASIFDYFCINAIEIALPFSIPLSEVKIVVKWLEFMGESKVMWFGIWPLPFPIDFQVLIHCRTDLARLL